MMYGFGLGYLSLTPGGANPTPVQVGVLQDVSLEIAMTQKELRGAYQFPVDVARAAGSVTGKAKSGLLGSATIAAILNATPSTGMKIGVGNEARTPVTNTTTVTNGATFFEDLGVINTNTGLVMQRVASAPATGQYSVNTATGAYTFAAADSNPPVLITYSYTAAAVGKTTSLTNQLMGAAATFRLDLHNNFKTSNFGWRLPAVVIPKLGWAPKQDDYTTIDIEFTAQADSTGKVLDFYSTE